MDAVVITDGVVISLHLSFYGVLMILKMVTKIKIYKNGVGNLLKSL